MGKSRQDATENVGSVPKTVNSFLYDKKRPGAFDEYVKWLCAKKEKSFERLQTDLLAIHRDTFEDVLSMMLNLGEHVCELNDANCVLRDILHRLPEYGRQATLIEEEEFMTYDDSPSSQKDKDKDTAGAKGGEKDEDIRKEEKEEENAINEEEDMGMYQYEYDLDDAVDMHAGHVEHGAGDDTVDMNKEDL